MGDPYGSLARETIQNSLDAAEPGSQEPVEVRFRIIYCSPEDIGANELTGIFTRCADRQTDGSKEQKFFELGRKELRENRIAVLEISDKNTTGLTNRRWKALVKERGSSENREGAGGSFGIGKHAPFAVSKLRTVFYWSLVEDAKAYKELFQGKAILTSHADQDGDMRQGTGFWGVKDGCREIQDEDEDIPDLFRFPFGQDVPGTSVYVMGFSKTMEQSWSQKMIRSVICNFFYSISERRLKIRIKPEEHFSELEISGDSLGRTFELLVANRGFENDREIEKAKFYWMLSREERAEKREKEIPGLGVCRLLVQTNGLPSSSGWLKRVGIVRGSGMMITDEQPKLKRFRGVDDFLALCICEDTAGNQLLREMENPQHNRFEPERILAGDRRRKATGALDKLVEWIRECVEEIAGRQARGEPEHLGELAQFLPDPEPAEDLPGDNREERDLDGGQEVSGGRSLPAVAPRDDDKDGDDDVTADPSSEAGGESGQTHERAGVREGIAKPSSLSNVRVRPPSSQDPAERRVSFTTHTDGRLSIRIYAAGDSDFQEMEIHRENITAQKNGRNHITFRANEALGKSALIVKAYEAT